MVTFWTIFFVRFSTARCYWQLAHGAGKSLARAHARSLNQPIACGWAVINGGIAPLLFRRATCSVLLRLLPHFTWISLGYKSEVLIPNSKPPKCPIVTLLTAVGKNCLNSFLIFYFLKDRPQFISAVRRPLWNQKKRKAVVLTTSTPSLQEHEPKLDDQNVGSFK